ncbi:MAG TPA: sigma-70 family RNA polymerase sigma factor [Candidatus Saccharimonadales bacterium]|nr:sigma-70 family RNA polymerase sigma factor [Candidatus Saccharimonadales bacterium]
MPQDSSGKTPMDPSAILSGLGDQVESLYGESCAEQWHLTRKQFSLALERSVRKRFCEGPAATRQNVEEYLKTLHIGDLSLASACMEGSEPAWEYFVENYRSYLRAAAGAITKGSRFGADAQEMADSLFAELFGLVDGKRGEASLLRYFHGRSSLKTWLRTVLAQRHVDRIRQSRRFEPLEHEDGDGGNVVIAEKAETPAIDPHREEYTQRFVEALKACLELLAPEDRRRLELYYAREQTLAEIGRILGEHESSVSRNLGRVRRELRANVEQQLRTAQFVDSQGRRKAPMSEAEIEQCLQYAGEDAPIDFRKLFPGKTSGASTSGRKESS